MILVYMYGLLQSTYYLKNFLFLNLECKNWQFLKKQKSIRIKIFLFHKKMQTIKTGIHLKVKSIFAIYK